MATPENKVWTHEDVLKDMGVEPGSPLGRLVIGQRDINGRFFMAITLILEAIADPNNPKLQQAAKLVAEVPGRIPPGCSDPR